MFKKIYRTSCLIILLISMYSCKNSNQLEKELKKSSNETNRDCPIVIDKYTTLSGTYVVNDNFIYVVKLKQNLLNEIGLSKSLWNKKQSEKIRNIYCTDPDMEWFRSNRVTVTWSYEYQDGTHIGKIEVNSSDC